MSKAAEPQAAKSEFSTDPACPGTPAESKEQLLGPRTENWRKRGSEQGQRSLGAGSTCQAPGHAGSGLGLGARGRQHIPTPFKSTLPASHTRGPGRCSVTCGDPGASRLQGKETSNHRLGQRPLSSRAAQPHPVLASHCPMPIAYFCCPACAQSSA